jgi:hypothetical protein
MVAAAPPDEAAHPAGRRHALRVVPLEVDTKPAGFVKGLYNGLALPRGSGTVSDWKGHVAE